MKLYSYYVIKRRYCYDVLSGKVEEYIHIMDSKEAIKYNWIDKNGNRIWIIPPAEEKICTTSVYGFDDMEEAFKFYDILLNNQIGMKVRG